MLTWAITCTLGAPPVAVVGLGDADADRVGEVRNAEPGAISSEAMWLSLTGTEDPREPNAASLARMLEDAREAEGRFDTTAANELRAEIGRAFARTVRPTEALRDIAARAAHDAAATLLAEGDRDAALEAAAAALRSFPDTELDATRHPPQVLELFERARRKVRSAPRGRLRVESDPNGTIVVDGFVLGPASEVEHDLPVGRYRLWWIADARASLPHTIELTAEGTTVRIDAGFETTVRVHPGVAIDCPSDCATALRALGVRLGVARIIGVRPEGRGTSVDIATAEASPWPPDTVIDTSRVARAQFSPWYLVPLGVGQFAQKRWVLGASYAAAEIGLLVWHLIAWQRHADAVESNDFGREPDLRSQRNLSAGLFYGSLAAGVAEALIVGWLTGE